MSRGIVDTYLVGVCLLWASFSSVYICNWRRERYDIPPWCEADDTVRSSASVRRTLSCAWRRSNRFCSGCIPLPRLLHNLRLFSMGSIQTCRCDNGKTVLAWNEPDRNTRNERRSHTVMCILWYTQELNRILYLFQLFIAACGLSHLSMMVNMIAATLGSSWFSMLMKAAAAIVSVYTAFVLPSATREAANRIYTKIQNQLVKEKRLESEKATALVTRCIADHVNKATSGIEAIQRTTQAVVKYTKGFRASAISIPLEAEHVNRHSASASRASVTLGDEMFFVTRSFTENKDAKPNLGAVKASESSNLGLISAFQNDNARDQFLREVRHVLHEGGIRKISTMAAAFLLGPNAPRALLTQLGRRIRQQRQNTKGSSVTISPEQDWACWYAVRIRVPLQLVEDQYTDSTFWMPTNIPDEYLFNNNTLSKPLKSGNSRRSSNAAFERLSDCRWADSQATVDSSDSSQVKADSFTYAIMLVCDPIEKDSLQDAHGVLFDVAQQLSTTLQRTHVLQQERDQLKQLAEMEKQKRQANDTFLSMISHELRTPLHAILGYSELLQERIESEDLKEYLHTIAASGSSLCELLNDIIDLTK